MCFGKKESPADNIAPRPASATSQSKKSKMPSNPPAASSAAAFNDFAPPPGPPPPSTRPQHDYDVPPPGPPPIRDNEYIAPPPGPPPSASIQAQYDYAAPPGPPPSASAQYDYTAPPGPPPSHTTNGKKDSHNWEALVPDTSLFPPPPAIFSSWESSPTNNATEAEAEAGRAWCEQYPLIGSQPLSQDAFAAVQAHNFNLLPPQGFRGTLSWRGSGVWALQAPDKTPDSCFLSYPPAYVPTLQSPLATGRMAAIYYEVRVASPPGRSSRHRSEVSLAMGFAALPYPGFRLPGWHRGSLAVHGDDGHRYVNDPLGGKSFTEPFVMGATYGIGMVFKPRQQYGNSAPVAGLDVEVIFTRNGIVDSRWDLHEETDAEHDDGVVGLAGYHDLCYAVGAYDQVDVEIIFNPAQWKYKELCY